MTSCICYWNILENYSINERLKERDCLSFCIPYPLLLLSKTNLKFLLQYSIQNIILQIFLLKQILYNGKMFYVCIWVLFFIIFVSEDFCLCYFWNILKLLCEKPSVTIWEACCYCVWRSLCYYVSIISVTVCEDPSVTVLCENPYVTMCEDPSVTM